MAEPCGRGHGGQGRRGPRLPGEDKGPTRDGGALGVGGWGVTRQHRGPDGNPTLSPDTPHGTFTGSLTACLSQAGRAGPLDPEPVSPQGGPGQTWEWQGTLLESLALQRVCTTRWWPRGVRECRHLRAHTSYRPPAGRLREPRGQGGIRTPFPVGTAVPGFPQRPSEAGAPVPRHTNGQGARRRVPSDRAATGRPELFVNSSGFGSFENVDNKIRENAI